jgi:glycosyltransferase involved in cell wall biosynthesis
LRIGVVGGVPAALGGGGLELQVERTAAALEARGCEVVRVAQAGPDARWDVLHAFGSEGDVGHALGHWTRNRSPLVITPVLVISPGLGEIALRVSSRWRLPVSASALRARALRGADALIAATEYEAQLVRRLVGRDAPVEVVPNAVDAVAAGDRDAGPPGHVLLLGMVSARKRQAEVLDALDESGPVVVAGAFSGSDAERRSFEAAVARTGATWLGDVRDPGEVARLERDAAALVHFSRAEVQSLAVLETLAAGTPVVLSDIPSHRELAAAHPEHVRIARSLRQLPRLVAELRDAPPTAPAPALPTWDHVAQRLETVYRRLLT